jgi:hypothetical protein
MNWEQLKVGDAVGVRRGRWSASPSYERGVVAKVCVRYVAIADGRKFSRKDGRQMGADLVSYDLVSAEMLEAPP